MHMVLVQYLEEQQIPFEQDVLLSKKTWIKTGGVCACWVTPHSVEQLANVCRFLYANNIAYDIVGQTSNIFFHSTYNPQVVVSTIKVNQYEMNDGVITCDCGVSVVKLSKDYLSQGYAGFYGLVGLPGTVASAIVNNASCFNCSLSSMLVSADVLMQNGSVKILKKDEFKYSHRSSAFKQGEIKGIVLSVKLKAEKAESIKEEYRKSEETVTYRKEKQEKQAGKTLGSVFASRTMKRNFCNKMVSVAMRFLPGLLKCEPRYIQKKAILFLYGYRDLDEYCSDRQINTFIWKDENAEPMFIRYKELMNKVYDKPEIEIEERV